MSLGSRWVAFQGPHNDIKPLYVKHYIPVPMYALLLFLQEKKKNKNTQPSIPAVCCSRFRPVLLDSLVSLPS